MVFGTKKSKYLIKRSPASLNIVFPLRNKFKKAKIWKNAKYIEIQYSTDKSFESCVKSVKIRKGTVDKAKARTTLSNLKPKRTNYVRVRLWDNNGVYSNWSKTVKINTKK